MPRANRYWAEGAAYHLTHRCHDRAFLLRFAADRDAYRDLLRSELSASAVSLLGYCITCNHVHLLVSASRPETIAKLVQAVHGQFAAQYNRRRGRQGAFWSDRYHATQIDSGSHLWACLKYIDLNMVRAGVVVHPRDWPWSGWHELTGERRRWRLIDRKALLDRLEGVGVVQFEEYYRTLTDTAVTQAPILCRRDAQWTESIAVGSSDFVRRVETSLRASDRRSRMERVPASAEGAWVLRETPPAAPWTAFLPGEKGL